MPWWLEWLSWLLLPLLKLVILTISLFVIARLVNVLAVPFNAHLCQKLMRQQPENPLTLAAEKQSWRDLPRLILHECIKLFFFLLWFVPLMALSLVPFIGVIAAALLFYFKVYWNALEYIDYPLAEAGFNFRDLRKRISCQRLMMLGFGISQELLFLIPLLNLASVPAGVAGATQMCLRHPLPTTQLWWQTNTIGTPGSR